jgi:hypothetical protein
LEVLNPILLIRQFTVRTVLSAKPQSMWALFQMMAAAAL